MGGSIMVITSIFVLMQLAVTSSQGLTESRYALHVTWDPSVNLREYTSYGKVHMLEFNVPDATVDAIWELQAISSDVKCPVSNVIVYLQQGGYPVIAPYNESFSSDFYVPHKSPNHLTIPTDASSHPVLLSNPLPGSWFAVAFLDKRDHRYLQKGLSSSCGYALACMFMSRTHNNIPIISTQEATHVTFLSTEKEKLFRFMTPENVYRLVIHISIKQGESNTTGESRLVPLYVRHNSLALPMEHSVGVNCTGVSSCKLKVASPHMNAWNYVQLSMATNKNTSEKIAVSFKIHAQTCNTALVHEYVNEKSAKSPLVVSFQKSQQKHHRLAKCYILPGVGRLNVPQNVFSSLFMFPDGRLSPQMYDRVPVPDGPLIAISFQLRRGQDTGGTLKLSLEIGMEKNINMAVVLEACITLGRIPSKSSLTLSAACDDLLMVVNSTGQALTSSVYIPYPQYGTWYMSLQSRCYTDTNGSVVYEACPSNPWAVIGVEMTRCVDNSCGDHGVCKDYHSGVYMFSACDCTAGWQGYTCSDGSQAYNELPSVLLLTLSNMFFIPSIILATSRHLYIESLVYIYTMFFSTFYHACDGTQERSLCIMRYDVLSFCDFYGSILSFWVTVLAMTRIHERLRAILHVVGALCIALGVEYDRHGLWVFLIPVVVGLAVLIASWAVQCWRRRRLFPSWRRYLYYLIPGLALVTAGLVIFSHLETHHNYRFTHSAWHMLVALSIVFFLPPKRLDAWRAIKFRSRSTHPECDSVSELEQISLDY